MNYILNDEQRRLVEEHLDIIDKVLRKTVPFNSGLCGMEYDDFYQIGAIGLCKAAVTYQSHFDTAFETYAFRVVKNAVLDHLRSILRKRAAYATFMSEAERYMEQINSPSPDTEMYEKLTLTALSERKVRYADTARKGIDAMVLKMLGYSGRDIAEKYSVKPNYITACISRAKKCLRNDKEFLKMIAC